MKKNPPVYSLIFTLIYITSFIITAPTAIAGEAENYISQLKKHYQKTLPISAFSLNYHFLNTQYRGLNYWDFQFPNRHMSVRAIEIDLVKRHFFDNDVIYFSGGRLFDRVQFQNSQESYFYERSATILGKGILRRGMDNFDRIKRYVVMNTDFLAVRSLLAETNIKENITLQHNRKLKVTTLSHKISDDNVIDYQFSNNPLKLISINHRALGGFFVYSNYRTTRDITFAHTVHQYYDGAKEATYVSFIDNFNIIKNVEPEKLKLPEGYGPELPQGDGILISEEIAKNLYLVTDSSANRNGLFKVNGDNISLYGTSGNSQFAEKTIKLILNQFPNRTINSVYVTHPHANQIAGLKVYARHGISIIADQYTIDAIKAYPDFSDSITTFKFQKIEHEQTIDNTHFYILENMHSKRQSFAYFKDSGILFQADFLHIPFDNTIASVIPSYTRSFIDFVRSKQLNIKRIVGNHRNNNISVEVMNKIYDANK